MITYAFLRTKEVEKMIFDNGLEYFEMPTNLGHDSLCITDENIKEIINIEEEGDSGINDLQLVHKWSIIEKENYNVMFMTEEDSAEMKNYEVYNDIVKVVAKKYKKSIMTTVPNGKNKTDMNTVIKRMKENNADFTVIFYGTLKDMKTVNTEKERHRELFGKKLFITDGMTEGSPGVKDGFVKMKDTDGKVYGSMNNKVAFITMDIVHEIKKEEKEVLEKIFDNIFEELSSDEFKNNYKKMLVDAIDKNKGDIDKIESQISSSNNKKIRELNARSEDIRLKIERNFENITALQMDFKRTSNEEILLNQKSEEIINETKKLVAFLKDDKFISLNLKNEILVVLFQTKNEDVFEITLNLNTKDFNIKDIVGNINIFKTHITLQMEVTELLAKYNYEEAVRLICNFLNSKKEVAKSKESAEVIL